MGWLVGLGPKQFASPSEECQGFKSCNLKHSWEPPFSVVHRAMGRWQAMPVCKLAGTLHLRVCMIRACHSGSSDCTGPLLVALSKIPSGGTQAE